MFPRTHRHARSATAVMGGCLLLVSTSLVSTGLVGSGTARATESSQVKTAAASAACPWVGSVAPVPQRVAQVLAQMTQAQQESLVGGVGSPYAGSIPAIPALCIPALTLEDGPAGVADGLGGVTQLPAPVSAAATWDTHAIGQYGTVIGSEQAGKGTSIDLGPTVNIVRDPRWGRAFESLGEDPYLAGSMGAAEIRGIQEQGVMAQVKHLAAYNQETNRNSPADNVIADNRTLQEIYLPAFQAATQSAVSSVMCSYSWVNGTPACENSYLQNTVLKGQFSFPGFVTSDWFATHSTVASANSGLDMEMPGAGYYSADALNSAIASGQVPASALSEMVGRILTEMFSFGLFDRTQTGSTGANVATAAHAATGQQVAEEGTVLLKNSGAQLPLSTSAQKTVAVIGSDASTGVESAGGGSAGVTGGSVSPLQGITSRAGSGVNVQYSEGNPASDTLPNVPASALTPASGGGTGLTAQFYNNTSLSGTPVLTLNNNMPDTDFNGTSPGAGVNATNWSAKWTGTVTAPSTGTYTFAVTSDDGSRLSVNGQQIINQWRDQPTSTASGSISLTAGQPVAIELDYYQGGGGDNVSLAWAPPNFTTPAITSAINLAKNSSVAVVFANMYEAEGGDLATIDLPGTQNELIEQVAAANPHTVVVLNTGSAVTMPWLDSVSGVLESWYPGQSNGTAIARLLYGDVNPSGKLPVSFPKSLTDVPAATTAQWPGVNNQVQYSEGLNVGYRWYQAKNITPLFPFGFGLSYTTFSFSGLAVSGPDSHGNATVTATVTNTGSKDGADVAQLYIGDPATTDEPPLQLKGFQRVDLAAGASKQVTFPITAHDLSSWDETAKKWTTSTGSYAVKVGDTSSNPQLSGSLNVTSTSTGNTVTFAQPGGMSSPVGTAASLTVKGTDSASGQSLTYTAANLPDGLSISASTGTISGTATTAGTRTVTVTGTDSTGATGNVTFLWTTTGAGTSTGGGGGNCGTTNVAQGKTATASTTENSTTAASAAVDGDTSTRWSSAFADPQWLQVDLGSTQSICQVTLNWEAASAQGFQIQTSADGTTWTPIYTTTTGPGGVRTLNVTGTGRYLRMYGTARNTPYGYSLWELGVYTGTGGGNCGTTNVAQGKTATASTTENSTTAASAAVDGDTSTRWSSAFADPQWLQVDLGSTQSICQVTLNWEAASAQAFQIQTSADGTTWTPIYTTTTGPGGVQTLNVTGTGRYLRMYGTARNTPYGYSLWELGVNVSS
jgi:beta-glucosidase